MPVPVRYPSGVTNVSVDNPFGHMRIPDPTSVSMFFDDFHTFNAGDWTIDTTEGGNGSATEALGDEDGGVLVITNDDAASDADWFQSKGEGFSFTTGKKLVFKIRFKVSDAEQSNVVAGLQVRDTSPMAVADGVYFRKDDGDTNIDFVVMKGSSATTVSAISTLEDDTYVELAFYYDGAAEMAYYVDGVKLGHVDIASNIPTTELTVSFGIGNGEADAKVMTVDYILACKDR